MRAMYHVSSLLFTLCCSLAHRDPNYFWARRLIGSPLAYRTPRCDSAATSTSSAQASSALPRINLHSVFVVILFKSIRPQCKMTLALSYKRRGPIPLKQSGTSEPRSKRSKRALQSQAIACGMNATSLLYCSWSGYHISLLFLCCLDRPCLKFNRLTARISTVLF